MKLKNNNITSDGRFNQGYKKRGGLSIKQSKELLLGNNGGETYYNNFRLLNETMQVSEQERKI